MAAQCGSQLIYNVKIGCLHTCDPHVSKMMIPNVSIIIPVYNAEKWLERCIKSIQSQTLVNFELILINDGSTDNSLQICNYYRVIDNRIKVINQKNGGVATARQVGIEHARGEYTIHCDADDWVEPDWLESLYTRAIEIDADLVSCDFFIIRGDETIVSNQKPEHETVTSYKIGLNKKIYGCCWNKLIRTSLFKDKVSFEQGINFQEDKLFIYKILDRCSVVSHVSRALYNYNQNNADSAIKNQSTSTLLQSMRVQTIIMSIEKNKKLRNELFSTGLIEFYVDALWRDNQLDNSTFLNTVKPFRTYLKHWKCSKLMRLKYFFIMSFPKQITKYFK